MYELIQHEQTTGMVMVESMAWRVQQEILSFEQEANDSLERIKTMVNKQALSKKNAEHDSSFMFNFKSSIIVVGVNPENFLDILNVSKNLSALTGFTENFLLQSKLRILLPKLLQDFHDRAVKKYLQKKCGEQSFEKYLLI